MSLANTLDPLDLLRQYTVQKQNVELLDNDGNLTKDLLQAVTVRFGEDASFPRDTPTQFLRSNSESDQYTLSALLHFLDHRNQSFYEYMKTTNSLGLQTVSFGDRGNILDYLTGKTADIGSSKAGVSAVGSGDGAAASASIAAGDKHGENVDAEGRPVRMRTSATDSMSAGAAGDRLAGGAPGATSSGGGDSARDIMRRERVLVTTSTALSSNSSFASVNGLIKELFPSKSDAKASSARSAEPGSSAPGPESGSGASAKPAHRKPGRAKRRDPIIVVPAATTAMLNMYNIKPLLQDFQFVDWRVVMEKGGSKPRDAIVERKLQSTGHNLRFRIVDSVQDFTDADWNSVVCVFTQGAAWQFKNWIWKSPQEVFQNCLGFYPKYQDEQLKESTGSWGIKPLNIERSRRHMDRATVTGLWSSIEQYIALRKPDLMQ
ncbi:accessory factor associated with RNA polymerase II [Coemansia sp. RSA 1813]|nr:accessory factor associated with RNA polymerase II [Coemansia sp. RSA 1646]KAJ1766975.1 accessory factor associated with RNA polymerase II [Coemansia sp. RSA 1843]KAJ2088827.1 accessory factor associated with RNA polymerase II [Coemansia sp. RSA 986]KAJ2212343.1 accessory factor associated with RNA polymerase II [Coemansia sp. RSA 487]KAJ2566690.1 accessory factor associated with RNA polymerase II [Coemansia sp. RSA 1813]